MILRVCLLWLMGVLIARAVVEGEPDTFAPVLNGAVMAMHPTSDGGVVICGSFTEVNGTPRARIAKLFADGSVDPAFDPGAGADDTIHCIAPAGTSGYFIGGDFLNYDGQSRGRIAQVSGNGALVTSFNPRAGANATVRCLSSTSSSPLASSTTLWVGGDFTQVRGINCKYFVQLGPTGSFTSAFLPGTVPKSTMQPNGVVRSFAVTPHGMFIGGDFTIWGGYLADYLTKVDMGLTTVTPFQGFNGPVTAIVSRTDWTSYSFSYDAGSLICMGSFTQCKGQPRLGFAHLTTGPSPFSSSSILLRDTRISLTGGVGRCGVYPYASSLDPNQIHLGGEFTGFNDYPASGLASMDARTAWPYSDEDYLSPRGTSAQAILPAPKVLAMARTINGDRIYVGGEFSSIGGKPRSGIARLYGPSLTAVPLAVTTLKASPLDDTRVMLHWNSSSGATSYQLQRSPAGASNWTTIADNAKRYHLDTGLTAGTGYSYRVVARNFNGQTPGTLTVNTTTDAGPWTGSGAAAAGQNLPVVYPSNVYDCDFFPDGRVMAAGSDQSVTGRLPFCITMLKPDGVPDPGFILDAGFSGTCRTVKVQPDGKILVGGTFGHSGNSSLRHLVRFHADGSVDSSFTPTLRYGTSTSFTVYRVDLLPGGRVVVLGDFNMVDGHPQRGIAVLMPDGRRDPSFDPGTGIGSTSLAKLEVLPDGTFLVSGLSYYTGVPATSPFLIRPDGSLALDFQQALEIQSVNGAAVDSDSLGRIYVGGSFTVDASGPRNLVRLLPDGTRDTTFTPPALLTDSSTYGTVRNVRVMRDGKVLVFGDFVRCGDFVTGGIARLMPDGSLDPSFRASAAMPYRFPDSTWSDLEAFEIDPFNRVWILGMDESAVGLSTPGLICLDTLAEAPAAPGSATAAPSREGGVTLAWTPDPHGYATRIEGRPAGTETWSLLAEVPAPSDTWWHRSALPGSAWEYRLSAVNKVATSAAGEHFPGAAYDPGRLWAAAAGVADLADMEADGDGDGVPLSLEYAFGGDPHGPGDPRPEGWTLFDRFFLSYPRLRADLNYVVEQSQDGIEWTEEGVHQGPAGTSAFASVPMEGPSTILLRVNVQPK